MRNLIDVAVLLITFVLTFSLGGLSNVYSLLAGAATALSVTLTALSIIGAVITIPAIALLLEVTVIERFVSAFPFDGVVLGGGNAKGLTRLPMGCRMGDNANAFLGGFRMLKEAKK